MKIKNINFKWNNNYSIFSSEKFLSNNSLNYGWISGFIEDELKFVLPYQIRKSLFFKHIKFITETIYIDDKLRIEDEKEFLNSTIAFLKKKNIDFVSQSPTHVLFKTYPDDAKFIDFASYVIDLSLSEDELWANLHQKHRNIIRNAIKNNIIIKEGLNEIESAYNLLISTMKRSNKSFMSFEKFKELITKLEDNVKIFVAYHNNIPQGCAVLPFSNIKAYYSYGGSISKPILGAINLLHWHAIKYFKGINVGYYDFVGARIKPEIGSKIEGIQRFKSRFGGVFLKGYLWKIPLKKWKSYLYDFLYRTLKNRAGDIIDQESMKTIQ